MKPTNLLVFEKKPALIASDVLIILEHALVTCVFNDWKCEPC